MTQPYYQDDRVTLYQGDALEVMPELTAGMAHVVLTDPPYVIGAVSAGNMASKSGGWADMMNSDGSLWSFCNWRTFPVVMNAAVRAQLPITSLMVWDKEWIGPGGQQGLRPSYEMCALMAKPGFAIPDRGIPDIWRHKVGGHKPNGHPAEKPVGLMERVLRTCDLPSGALVVEPFAGSGTTAIAAKSMGLRCVAIEAEERWCELIASRLSQDVLDFGEVA